MDIDNVGGVGKTPPTFFDGIPALICAAAKSISPKHELVLAGLYVAEIERSVASHFDYEAPIILTGDTFRLSRDKITLSGLLMMRINLAKRINLLA
ncbi:MULTISPECIES: hypothetical protein [unclassified Mesorhizobium]|uniref:hypothetical protein n=1 Tax=unclassified Mesorhizobium TaxID=325217 RepID=UPI000FCB886F|nr:MULTISPECIES: hypothetical protein [unclassified Mesorhizobium]RUV58072.1 hypothetical protein EOA85_14540 [Mesorhizobium sp. M5C.F.Ca.IN.020.29.1.1]RWB04820.1 MAG: hypothetical protein EOQ33_07610 [Mesorhizobium sp.]RWC24219.1 MAG: hypothetical protein EOS51_04535 [Mesorhizobium sp.]RWD85473.1 MAG: hypothetical protein EOS48_05145 [Mesorhizobium sp.]RWE53206.1 MAG: hypothetical protein EOS67_28155 [Mesorhizobium sp.]